MDVTSTGPSRLGVEEVVRDLAAHERGGGIDGLRAALAMSPDEVIAVVEASGLRGRGGAGFPTGRKWRSVRDAADFAPFVVCNAAEGEPATFKDRWLLRRNPYQVLVGLAIAAHAVGAATAFLAIKEKFEVELGAVRRALHELSAAGLVDHVDIEIVTGPDAYLFGEETAMLEVIEGRQALPRVLPPYQVGLFATRGNNNATVVNNAETLGHVTSILAHGAQWFRGVGTGDAPGTMLFTVCGDVTTPRVAGLPLGRSLGDLIEVVGGGLAAGRTLKVVFPGASASVLGPADLATPLSWSGMRDAGSALGSGGFAIYDDTACIVAATLVFAEFLADASCGQCPACPRGCDEVSAALWSIEQGRGTEGDLDLMRSRLRSITGGSRCGLPVGAQRLITSVLDMFDTEIREHLGQTCPHPRALVLPMVVGADEVSGELVMASEARTPVAVA